MAKTRAAIYADYYQNHREAILVRKRVTSKLWRQRAKAADPEKVRAEKRRWHEKNRDRILQMNNARYAATKDHPAPRPSELKRYGDFTQADYLALLTAQDGRCAICRNPCKTGHRLSVDHDHGTKQVRGLLCYSCNAKVGNNTVETALAVLRYLRRARTVRFGEIAERVQELAAVDGVISEVVANNAAG